MTITTTTRQSTDDEITKEIDRRGAVIETLEARVAALEEALKPLLSKRTITILREEIEVNRAVGSRTVATAIELIVEKEAKARNALGLEINQ